MQTEKTNKSKREVAAYEFGKRLQYVMREKNISQSDIVLQTKTNKSTVSQWFNGQIKAGLKNNGILASFIGCNEHWLSSGEGEPFPTLQTSKNRSEFQTRRETRDKNKELDKLARLHFKMQRAPAYFEEFFDYIFENYGDNQEAVQEFLEELYQSNANFRFWLNEKKRENERLPDTSPGSKSVNGNE